MNNAEFWVKHGRFGSKAYRLHYGPRPKGPRRSAVNAYRRAYEAFRRSDPAWRHTNRSPDPPAGFSGRSAAELRRKVVRKLKREGVL